ncbi:MAG TPA: nucleoside triphosphate pyrophosphohydrolase [Ilumatobacter sp.]|nr:nucleoside triphosphate pyrophosphohydrolase [Ilumatobacter sp.]
MIGLPRVVVAGLGPGGVDHVTAETLATIERIPHRYLRTSRHPNAHLVPDAVTFDEIYERADSFADVYAEIADRLVAAAVEHGEVLYVVPGSPLVLERSVRALRGDARIECELLPAMSFLDVAWARLGIDPVERAVRLIDGHEFTAGATGATGALLVAHTHANWVLSDIKLAIDDPSGALDATPVVLLHALGTPDEAVVHTTWAEMDRTIEADHLTSLYVPSLTTPVGGGYVRFHELARTLREQCPWDIEQTHQSLLPYLIEETYEVVDAIQGLDAADPATDEALIEELGDLLYQIEFHATIAEQEGRFTIADVTRGVHDKLVRRHPHVFGDAEGNVVDVDGAGEVLSNWEKIKRAEKARTSVFDGVPSALPGLAYAGAIQRKAAKVGFDWPDVSGALPKIAEEAGELAHATTGGSGNEAIADELGDLLFAVVNVARHLDVDPEVALRAATHKFRSRVEQVEQLATARGIDMHTADLDALDAMWNEVKGTSGAWGPSG